MTPKQVLVIRKDLNMRKGKIAAQAAHASMKVLLDLLTIPNPGVRELDLRENDALFYWITGLFTKICVSVDSEKELLELHQKAQEAGLLVGLIEDCGATEFHGIPTKTCLAIGPAYPPDIDPITSHLKLL